MSGVGIGHTTNGVCSVTTFSCDDESTAAKALFDYNINKNLGVELSYNNIGKVYLDDGLNQYSAGFDTDAYALTVVGRFEPLESLSLFGKVGTTSWMGDATLNLGAASNDFEDDGSDITYGLGVT